MSEKNLFSVWKKVFGNWKYVALSIIITLIFYSFKVLISSYDSLISFYGKLGLLESIKLLFSFFIGFKETTLTSSFISLIFITILFGILFSLIIYKTKMIKSVSGKTGIFTTTGIFLGVLAPSCATCGIGLLSLFGISAAALSFLPYDGLELSILAIGILSFSTFEITKDIKKGILCEVDFKK
jgi:hypothetical protein|tara:strand:+ start:21 stop:569 length:549 start_codon:yes stop_codon:yes gene_type:complete